MRIGNNYLGVKEQHIVRRDAFYNPDKAFEAGVEALFSGLVSQTVKTVISIKAGTLFKNVSRSRHLPAPLIETSLIPTQLAPSVWTKLSLT